MVSSGPGAVNKLIYKSLPYDPLKDFAPVVLVANVPTIILVSPKLPVANLKDVVAYGKLHARELSIGNPGYGTGGHIAAVQFAARDRHRSDPRAVSRRGADAHRRHERPDRTWDSPASFRKS